MRIVRALAQISVLSSTTAVRRLQRAISALALGCILGMSPTLGAERSHATVIYDNGAFDPSNLGAFNSEGTAQRLADDFVLASSATIRSTQFWGSHTLSGAIPAVEDFTIVIYGNGAGVPNGGSVLGTSLLTLVTRIDTGFNNTASASSDLLEYTMDLVTPVALGPGTYWFSLYLATNAPNTTFQWAESGPNGSGNLAYTHNVGASWTGHSDRLAFNLSDNFAAVPEPGTALLMCLGLIGLGANRKRLN